MSNRSQQEKFKMIEGSEFQRVDNDQEETFEQEPLGAGDNELLLQRTIETPDAQGREMKQQQTEEDQYIIMDASIGEEGEQEVMPTGQTMQTEQTPFVQSQRKQHEQQTNNVRWQQQNSDVSEKRMSIPMEQPEENYQIMFEEQINQNADIQDPEVSNLEYLKLHALVEKGAASPEAAARFAAWKLERENNSGQQDPDTQKQREIDEVLLRHRSRFASEAERKQYEDRQRMSELRARYQELRQCPINEQAMKEYSQFMEIKGMNKVPLSKAAENPVQQKQAVSLLLKQRMRATNNSNSRFSDRQSSVSLQEQVQGSKTFLERQIQKLTVDDKAEKFKIRVLEAHQLQQSKALGRDASSPVLKPHKSMKLELQRMQQQQRVMLKGSMTASHRNSPHQQGPFTTTASPVDQYNTLVYEKSGIFNNDLSQPSRMFDLTTAADHRSKHDASARNNNHGTQKFSPLTSVLGTSRTNAQHTTSQLSGNRAHNDASAQAHVLQHIESVQRLDQGAMNFESKIGLHGDKEEGKSSKRVTRNLKISTNESVMDSSKLGVSSGKKSVQNALKLDLDNMQTFDKKLIKHLVQQELLNAENVREAVSNQAKAHKPFFNLQPEVVGSVTFLPSPEGRSLRQLQRSRLAPSPSAKVLEAILAEAKGFGDDIDLSKSKEEIRMERKMEKKLKEDEYRASEQRKQILKTQVKEYNERIGRKDEVVRRRRHSIHQMQTAFKVKESLKLPDINPGNRVEQPSLLALVSPQGATKTSKGQQEASEGVSKRKSGLSQAKTTSTKKKGKEAGEAGSQRYERRPRTNNIGVHKSPDPRPLFEASQPLEEGEIDDLVKEQEDMNKCATLAQALDMHTSPDLSKVPAFSPTFKSKLRQRRKTLDHIKNPSYINENKFVENSKILQLAFLDKIIEECDEDQDNNHSRGLSGQLTSFKTTQDEKIKNDALRLELEVKKDEDFEYQLAFEKSFYGKASAATAKKDQYEIRRRMGDSIGSNHHQGISQSNEAFWKGSARAYSKPFLSRFPALTSM